MLVKFPAEDGRIKLARVNCEVDMALCKKNHIQAFPSIRIFRSGNDLLVVRPPYLSSPSALLPAPLPLLCRSGPANTSQRTPHRPPLPVLSLHTAPSAWWCPRQAVSTHFTQGK
jgi:hypothetical protein